MHCNGASTTAAAFVLVGHIFLQKKTWRAIVLESQQRAELLRNTTNSLASGNASISFELISLYARLEFKDVYDHNMEKGDSSWYMDQVLCSMLLTDYRANHTDFKLHERGRANRLDRSSGIAYWNRDNFDGFGDAHLIHDTILLKPNWIVFNKLLRSLFNETTVELLNHYYRQYIIAGTTTSST